ncbi:YolD-like family protein [Staphylococcus rostri]|uniref:YolD-like family protein n=1 Tax=Staphylococcus rostri TaxID=522262 RepID=A0A2K3YKP2_9STAP|nr:YolD-like family protein [Staphylococcus rostri]PNZ26179.1 YolD-like family protein [Staphylococcus rostri]
MKNSHLPMNYHHETDYRKIPREYLETNIPNGRGIVKWAPFATLPEQFARLKQFESDQAKRDRPILSDDRLYELNYMLHLKLSKNESATFHYWYDGAIKSTHGYILSIHSQNQTLIVSNQQRTHEVIIPLNTLYAID